MTNSALKSVLNQKAAEASSKNAAPPISPQLVQPANGPSTQVLSSHNVIVSFSMALEDAAGFLERVRTILPAQALIRSGIALSPIAASVPLQSKEQPRPATEKISDKQTTMILNLIKRKKLTAEQVKALLLDKFGITDGRLLDKKQASQLISQLLA